MRIRVKDVLDLLAAGASRDEILADYPYLENGDITAALEYAELLRLQAAMIANWQREHDPISGEDLAEVEAQRPKDDDQI
jgi:hypothetical protein